MSDKKQLNLDERDAVSGGSVGNSRTGGPEICATDINNLHFECVSLNVPSNVENSAQKTLEKNGQVTLTYDENKWFIK